ncbi:hypothetical protein CFFPNG_02771 [Methylorubrum aminovorans]
MSIERRVQEVIERAVPLMPAQIRSEFLALLAAVGIGRLVALVAAWAASHAVVIGEIIDLVLAAALVAGLILMGWSVIEAARDLWKVVEITRSARREQDLDAAAALFAKAVTTLGVAVLNALLMRGLKRPQAGEKARGGDFDRKGADTPTPRSGRPKSSLHPKEPSPRKAPSSQVAPTPAQAAAAEKYGVDPKWIKPDGAVDWPPNNGFTGSPKVETLQTGTRLDRYGGEGGSFLAPAGTPFAQRALPSSSAQQPYHSYVVLKPLPVEAGPSTPWFGQPGGGMQYKLLEEASVRDLIDQGFLRKI